MYIKGGSERLGGRRVLVRFSTTPVLTYTPNVTAVCVCVYVWRACVVACVRACVRACVWCWGGGSHMPTTHSDC